MPRALENSKFTFKYDSMLITGNAVFFMDKKTIQKLRTSTEDTIN